MLATAAAPPPVVRYVSPHEHAWRCIRFHETVSSSPYHWSDREDQEVDWQYADGLYYGAYNMDRQFQRDYGIKFYYRWGTADNWPRWAQTYTADRGLRVQGWGAWPNTSRMCGLR